MIKRLRILPLVVVFLIFGCKSRQSTIPAKEETPDIVDEKIERRSSERYF